MTRTMRLSARLGILTLTAGLALAPFADRARAQTTTDRPAAEPGTMTNRVLRDDGFNYGWLGLLGLAGLAGLIPRSDRTVAVRRSNDATAR